MSHGIHHDRGLITEPAPGDRGLRILIANEPRAYRETISTVIAQLRPCFEVFVVEPLALERMLRLMAPDCVVCSGLTKTVELESPTWIQLYPEGEPHAVVSANGKHSIYPDLDFDALLCILDRVGTPLRSLQTEPT